MKSMRAREGWLSIDNRLGGAPSKDYLAQVAKLQQQGVHVSGALPGTQYESATITCCHCHTIVVLNPLRTRDRGYCARCHHYVCDSPGCNATCRPMQQVIDTLQAQAAKSGL